MGTIAKNLEIIKNELPAQVTLVAVSKTQTSETILEAYEAGHRCFGENKVQEITRKAPELPEDISWHFIGHLQRNKVKFLAPFVSVIEAVDSLRLLVEINKQAINHNRSINCLLQFHIATEQSKFGLDLDEAIGLLDSEDFIKMKNVRITGVMGMATYSDDEDLVASEFRSLKNYFDIIKESHFEDKPDFKEVSMGMSGDYQLAIKEGSTMVRIGTAIFGSRNYNI